MTIMLYVVPYIEGDKQDDNHYRVLDHHTVGLTNSTVIIEGEHREVRCCSRPDGRKHRDHNASILVHLKPRPRSTRPAMQCKFMNDLHFLRYVHNMKSMKSILDLYYGDDPYCSEKYPPNLLMAKLRKFAKKGYFMERVSRKSHHLTLSKRALLKLESANA